MKRPVLLCLLTSAFLTGVSTPVYSQMPIPRDTTHRAGKPLFTVDDALLSAAFAGLTVAMFPADKAAARRLRLDSSAENKFIGRSATGFEFVAHPGALIIGSSMYAVGKLTHHRELADVGLHGTEAVIVGTSLTTMVKMLAGRSRPFVSNATDPSDFKFGGGFSSDNRQSFPSGHTTSAFAAASSVTSEVKRLYPRATWIVGPALYGGASMVGLARMYHNKHWASDVALGAAVGTFSGLKIVRYSHNHPDNPVDRRLLGIMFQPNERGGQLAGISVAWQPR